MISRIDEAQFLDPDIGPFINELEDQGKRVIIKRLDVDFIRLLLGSVLFIACCGRICYKTSYKTQNFYRTRNR
ncbi:MAG: hypothetical protein FDW93_05350 [Bergeyella sp.]|nr:hypothetical protein [Bergeyella sp.]